MKLLELNNIVKTYQRGGWFDRGKKLTAVSQVSLDVPEGGRIGLIGRSGAGKSTLGRIILGLERPDNGTVRYKGKDVERFTRGDWKQFRREVQVVFQNAIGSVNPRWKIFDIISEPLRNAGDMPNSKCKERVREMLEMVGLCPEDSKRYPHQFSGGQLQRVCIARALAIKPQLVLLDEAVSSLDMLIQAQIIQLLRDLQDEIGVSYLFISHDIRVVAGFCDVVAIMHEGRISSTVDDLSQAKHAEDPILRQLANSILSAWPQTISC